MESLAAYSHLIHSPVVDLEASEDNIMNVQSPSGLLPTLDDTRVEKTLVYEEAPLMESLGSGLTAEEAQSYSKNGTCNEPSTPGDSGGVLTLGEFSCS